MSIGVTTYGFPLTDFIPLESLSRELDMRLLVPPATAACVIA